MNTINTTDTRNANATKKPKWADFPRCFMYKISPEDNLRVPMTYELAEAANVHFWRVYRGYPVLNGNPCKLGYPVSRCGFSYSLLRHLNGDLPPHPYFDIKPIPNLTSIGHDIGSLGRGFCAIAHAYRNTGYGNRSFMPEYGVYWRDGEIPAALLKAAGLIEMPSNNAD